MGFTIKAPEGCKTEDIKIETKMLKNTIETTVTYPNGFFVKAIMDGVKNTLIPSGELIDLGNGDFQIPN